MINKVILVGNVGRDPELKKGDNFSVCNFTVATNRKWRNRDGDLQEETEWHRITAFGKQSEIADKYLSKGRQVYVEGRLRTRSWEDRNTGEKKYSTEIVCETFKLLGHRENQDTSHQEQQTVSKKEDHAAVSLEDDEDIPF